MSLVTRLGPKANMMCCGIPSVIFKIPEMHISPWHWFRSVSERGALQFTDYTVIIHITAEGNMLSVNDGLDFPTRNGVVDRAVTEA